MYAKKQEYCIALPWKMRIYCAEPVFIHSCNMEITAKDFMLKQPNYPQVAESDNYYMVLAGRLAKMWDNSRLLMNVDDEVRRDVVLAVTGYFQDVVADAGIWRSFSTMCNELYGRPVPFFDRPDDYIDSELNEVDLRFMVWYVIESESEMHGHLSPHDPGVARLAHLFFNLLDAVYEDAPTPVEYKMAMDVDFNDEHDTEKAYDLSHWLFWNCYFLRPAATSTLRMVAAKAQEIINAYPDKDEAREHLLEMNRRVMVENTTGPLSLSIGEWMELIVNGKTPETADESDVEQGNEHRFYKQLVEATGGSRIAFIDGYDALEQFVGERMGWGKSATGHLPGMKRFGNFVLLGNRQRGLLIAHDVAQYIKHPENLMYDPQAARSEAHRIVTERGVAPIDLVKYLFENNLVPDARLPFEKDEERSLLHENWDFLARLYLQTHYRGD